jgi:hypothetical protein
MHHALVAGRHLLQKVFLLDLEVLPKAGQGARERTSAPFATSNQLQPHPSPSAPFLRTLLGPSATLLMVAQGVRSERERHAPLLLGLLAAQCLGLHLPDALGVKFVEVVVVEEIDLSETADRRCTAVGEHRSTQSGDNLVCFHLLELSMPLSHACSRWRMVGIRRGHRERKRALLDPGERVETHLSPAK